MSGFTNWWNRNIAVFVQIVRAVVVVVGVLWFSTGCRPNYDGLFHQTISSENFEGAKQILWGMIRDDSFLAPKQRGRAQAFYRLAYVYAKTENYDSMKVALDISVQHDGNFTKAKREMVEYFSLDEFNKAVFLYNNFFYDKAIEKLYTAITIIGTLPPYEEYSAVIYRCLAYGEAANKNVDKALEYCRKASQLGDALSKKVLLEWEKEQKISPPEKLEPREKPTLSI